MSEIILAKPFDHKAKNIWEACGFNKEEMDAKIQTWGPNFQKSQPSEAIEFIENLDVITREKIAIAYYICGILSSQHFDRTVQQMTALTAQTLAQFKAEIKRLGGSTNPAEFGKKPVAKKNRIRKR